jgi:hypothetical protein
MSQKLKSFNEFIIENYTTSNDTLDVWKKMMEEKDLYIYTKFNTMSNDRIRGIRDEYKDMRRFALKKLNDELKKDGNEGTLFSMDVEDSELLPYVESENKFFEYSRILDFADGYKPKNIIIVKKDKLK